MSIKQKILGFLGRHRLLVFSLFVAFMLPAITIAAGDVKIRMVNDGQPYLKNSVTGKYMTANRMLGPNGEVYYCVSKGLRGPDYLVSRGSYGTFSSPKKMSDLSKKVLLLGYPNQKIQGLSDVEQYHATQNAFWATVTHYDTANAPQMVHSTIDNLRANPKAPSGQYVLNATKDIYNRALSTDISAFSPSVTLSGPEKVSVNNNGFTVAGPFYVSGKNISSVNLPISVAGANGISIESANGQLMPYAQLGQPFYIIFHKNNNASSGSVSVSIKGSASYMEGLIYKAPHSSMQDMATLAPSHLDINLSQQFAWSFQSSGQVEISKIDVSSSKPLAGATIEIYNAAGQKIHSAVSNKEGKIISPTLTAGKYTFKETVAPSGYKLNGTVSSFEIKNDGEVVKATLTNEPIPDTPVQIKKIDATTKAVLRGAKIEVYSATGVKVFSGTTGANGIVEVGSLKAGSYTYKEVTQPAGYYHNSKTYNFTIQPGEGLKVLMIENTAIKKITVCDLTTRAMITIEETQFDTTKHSNNQDDCTKIDVCDLTTRKPVNIIKTAFDKTKHSTNWDDCAEIKVCDLKTRASITIVKSAFDQTKHSNNLDDCTKIDVCDLTTRKPVNIIKTAFDKAKHSTNWDDCAEIKVCDLNSRAVVTIVESGFDPAKHSRNQADCNPKVEVCELATKNIVTIDETKFDATKHSNNLEDCIPKIEVCDLNTKRIVTIKEADFDTTKYSKNIENCASTPPELPKTGPLETFAALIAITAVSLSVAYWYKSAQAVKNIKR